MDALNNVKGLFSPPKPIPEFVIDNKLTPGVPIPVLSLIKNL